MKERKSITKEVQDIESELERIDHNFFVDHIHSVNSACAVVYTRNYIITLHKVQ